MTLQRLDVKNDISLIVCFMNMMSIAVTDKYLRNTIIIILHLTTNENYTILYYEY